MQLGVRGLAAWQAGAGAQQEKRSKQKRRVSEMQVRLIRQVQRLAHSPGASFTCHVQHTLPQVTILRRQTSDCVVTAVEASVWLAVLEACLIPMC